MARRRRDEDDYDDDDDDRPRRGGAMSHVVPYKNPFALAGYYCGFGALLPVLGVLLGPVAVVLGIIGFVKARQNPQAHGTGHAVTAIILGLGGLLMCQPVWFFLGWAALKK
jgi:hypothetical protein